MTPGAKELDGRVALVTGAGRGIGRAIALGLADAGAAIVVNARASGEEADRLAAEIRAGGGRAFDELSAPLFAQSGIGATTPAGAAAAALVATGDAMVRAVVYHSDHLELSEQFDGTTGYERSVHNLTWSYAAYLSALRARAQAV